MRGVFICPSTCTRKSKNKADVASGSIGGLGLSPSACYGERYAYFEPVHGSAPDLVGKGIINPTAMLLSGAMMLTYLGYTEQGKKLERAIEQTYHAGVGLTLDQGGRGSTMEFIETVKESILKETETRFPSPFLSY